MFAWARVKDMLPGIVISTIINVGIMHHVGEKHHRRFRRIYLNACKKELGLKPTNENHTPYLSP